MTDMQMLMFCHFPCSFVNFFIILRHFPIIRDPSCPTTNIWLPTKTKVSQTTGTMNLQNILATVGATQLHLLRTPPGTLKAQD